MSIGIIRHGQFCYFIHHNVKRKQNCPQKAKVESGLFVIDNFAILFIIRLKESKIVDENQKWSWDYS